MNQPAVGRLHDAAPTGDDVLRGLGDEHILQSVRLRSLMPDLMQRIAYGTCAACSLTRLLVPQLAMWVAREAAR